MLELPQHGFDCRPQRITDQQAECHEGSPKHAVNGEHLPGFREFVNIASGGMGMVVPNPDEVSRYADRPEPIDQNLCAAVLHLGRVTRNTLPTARHVYRYCDAFQ